MRGEEQRVDSMVTSTSYDWLDAGWMVPSIQNPKRKKDKDKEDDGEGERIEMRVGDTRHVISQSTSTT